MEQTTNTTNIGAENSEIVDVYLKDSSDAYLLDKLDNYLITTDKKETEIMATKKYVSLEKLGLQTRVLTSLSIPQIAEPYIRRKADSHLSKGIICIFGGGTGNPYFSTDTTAALRASELNCDTILMAKNGTDGVYDCDPRKNPCAKRFCKITYDEILKNHLGVMDLTAATLCNDNNIQIVVFDMGVSGNIKKVINNPEIGTIITK